MKCFACFKKIKTDDLFEDPQGKWHFECWLTRMSTEKEAHTIIDRKFHHLGLNCDTRGKCSLVEKPRVV